MASFSPSYSLIPSWALGPVRAPKNPSFTWVAAAPPAVVAVDAFEDFLLLPHAAAVSVSAPTTATARTR